ncbi:MAG TPA: hypothetical protein VI819_02665 [Patescibacteria group bacterium]|nr:hypothetical protein [Patescibacteria group bacterium]
MRKDVENELQKFSDLFSSEQMSEVEVALQKRDKLARSITLRIELENELRSGKSPWKQLLDKVSETGGNKERFYTDLLDLGKKLNDLFSADNYQGIDRNNLNDLRSVYEIYLANFISGQVTSHNPGVNPQQPLSPESILATLNTTAIPSPTHNTDILLAINRSNNGNGPITLKSSVEAFIRRQVYSSKL